MFDNDTSVYTAECNCFTTGYFGVFEGDEVAVLALELATTTPAFQIGGQTTNSSVNLIVETTTAEQLLSEPEDEIESIYMTFSIDANFTAVIGDDLENATAEIKTWLATTMDVDETRITNLELTSGSIVIEFELLPGTSNSDTDLNTALSSLKSSVESGAAITIGGTSYPAIANSFDHTVKTEAVPETGPTEAPEKNGQLGVIIGAAVGGSLFIIAIVVIVAFVVVKKNAGSNKVEHSPRQSQAELGNYRFTESKVNPDDEALYGPAPTAAQPGAVAGSRHGSAAGAARSMTPVS